MKNELINEVTRIKSMMIINESSLINEITLPGIIKELMTVLKSEQKLIISKFLKNEIIDEVEKVAFSKFVNSSKGKLFISNLKNRVNNEIFDTLKQKTALDKIAKMEQSAKDWKAVKSSVKPAVNDLIDIKPEIASFFGNTGRKITAEQSQFLDDTMNKVQRGIHKLSPTEFMKLENELKQMGVSLQNTVTKLNNSKDIIQKQKAKRYQDMLNKFTSSLNATTTAVGSVKIGLMVKTVLYGILLYALTGIFFKLKGTSIWQWISSSVPNPFSPANPTNGNTTPNNDDEDDQL